MDSKGSNVGIQIITRSLRSERDWQRIVRIQCEWPELAPARYGAFEPLRKKFDIGSLAEAVHECWTALEGPLKAFCWKSGHSRMEGSFHAAFPPVPAYSGVAVHGRWEGECPRNLEALANFVHKIAAEFDGLIGFIHLLAEPEVSRWGQDAAGVVMGNDPPRDCLMLMSPMGLIRWLPDLFWGTVFGPPYVKMFGREKLLSAPAFLVNEIAPSVIYLQLSQSLRDMHERFEQVDDVRQRIKRHLGVDAFWRADAAKEHRYVVPDVFAEYL